MLNNKLSTKKLRCIYACAREQGLDNQELHELVYAETKEFHISTLTEAQALAVIERIKGKKNKLQVKSYGNRKGMASDAQIKKLFALMYELSQYESKYNGVDMAKRLNGLIKKHFGVDHIKFLTSGNANRLIEIIKNMIGVKQNEN